MDTSPEPLTLPLTAQFSNVTDPRKRSFIAAYAVCGRVGAAAAFSGQITAIGCDRSGLQGSLSKLPRGRLRPDPTILLLCDI